MSRLRYIRSIRAEELSATRLREAAGRRIDEIPHRLAWELTSLGREMRTRLSDLRDRHRGDRCFVVANGPSLRDTDLSLLNDEVTFGMNRIYRLEASRGFLPDYLACVDLDSQLEQIHDELKAVRVPKFLNWNGRHLFPSPDPTTVFVKLTFRPRFSVEPGSGLWGGHSVTFVCIQLAYHLGFTEVVLIGKDHSYVEQGVPGQVVTSSGKEDNHFMKGYYAPGATWRIPDYKGEELAYRMAREAFESDGRRILDATVDGKLEVFDKVDYQSLF